MFEPGQKIEILHVHENPQVFAPAVTLLEKQRDGSKGWEHWLVALADGKKVLRWLSPGTRIVEEAPVLTPNRIKHQLPDMVKEVKEIKPAPRLRLRAHKPQLPSKDEVKADRLQWCEDAIRVLQARIREMEAHSETVDGLLVATGLVEATCNGQAAGAS